MLWKLSAILYEINVLDFGAFVSEVSIKSMRFLLTMCSVATLRQKGAMGLFHGNSVLVFIICQT